MAQLFSFVDMVEAMKDMLATEDEDLGEIPDEFLGTWIFFLLVVAD
jgi:hypothetical protein